MIIVIKANVGRILKAFYENYQTHFYQNLLYVKSIKFLWSKHGKVL